MDTPRKCPLAFEQLESRIQPAVTFHGGVVLPHVQAQAVYIGSEWTATAGKAKKQALDGFLSYLVTSPYMTALTTAGYGVGTGSAVPGAILPVALNTNNYLTDKQIHTYLQSAIDSGKVQPPSKNRVYVVYPEPGVAVYDNSDGSTSVSDFLGYHWAFAGHTAAGVPIDIHYAAMPYPGGVNGSAKSQGFPTNFTELTSVTSHELAESATDPNVDFKQLGWYDDTNNVEIGDLTGSTVRKLNGYYVQMLVNQNDQVLSVAGAVKATGAAPTGGTGGSGFDSEVHAPAGDVGLPQLDTDISVAFGIRVG